MNNWGSEVYAIKVHSLTLIFKPYSFGATECGVKRLPDILFPVKFDISD